MDLYGAGASISQANAQTEAARQINEATRDFNNGLAKELDDANREQDEDRAGKLQKNIVSGTTSAGKLAIIKKRGGIKRLDNLVGGFKEAPLKREEVLAREVGEERAPLTNPPRAGEAVAQRPVGTTETYTAEGRLAEQEAEKASKVGTSAAVKTTAEVVEDVAGKAAKLGKIGVAGLGGGIDAFQDIGRLMEGKTGWDTFGSNNYARGGNIANIVGSSLELAGVATGGITPWSLALEGTGALIGLGGSIAEGFGEEKAGEESKQTEQEDITSEARSQTVAQNVEQAVGRTQ
jgi:hypothetical protein